MGLLARSERDEKRELGRSLGAVELVSSMCPTTNWCGGSWIVTRGGIAITESHMEHYRGIFQPPQMRAGFV